MGAQDYQAETRALIKQVDARLADLDPANKADKKKITALNKDKTELAKPIAYADALLAQIGGLLSEDEARELILAKLYDIARAELERYLNAEKRSLVLGIENLCGKYAVSCRELEAERDTTLKTLDGYLQGPGLLRMNANWSTCKLRDIADVRVSNVDKKTSTAETPIKLCNYMDVYANDYVTKSMDFMTASASKSEIERFGLQAGDVIITKDSETPDDIGVPAVVTDCVDGLVCGYHLALIRLRNSAINPIYLAKQLSTAPVSRHFASNATGSTRFGLPVSVIEDTRIPIAPIAEQTEIAEILSTVDRAIEQTEALIAKQQRIKTGLMQDLLTRGIDEHGNLRSEQTHQFKDSPLGRIPMEWDVRKIESISDFVTSGARGWAKHYSNDGAPFLRIGNLTRDHINMRFHDTVCVRPPAGTEGLRTLVAPGDVLISVTADLGLIGVIPDGFGEGYVNQHIALVRISQSRNRLKIHRLVSSKPCRANPN